MFSQPRHHANAVIRTLLIAATLGCLQEVRAADLETTRAELIAGKYIEVIASAKDALKAHSEDPEWSLLLGEALMRTGAYPDAREVLATAVQENPLYLRLRLASREAALATGKTDVAQMELTQLDQLGGSREWAYRKPEDRVALGRVALLVGVDPKRVLELFYDPVRKEAPTFRGSYLAAGDLALAKNDFALASRNFATAAKRFPEDPDAWFGLARAFAPSDREKSAEALTSVLEFNPKHTGAFVLFAEFHIDSEDFTKADAALAEALKINPNLPEAHALRCVLAHLRNDAKAEKAARADALKFAPQNPTVPHLIGRKLSQKYRFAEGAALQREALKWDANFVPAKAQLANDLLRLGNDEEGWRIAEEVQKADPYDVVAYNLMTLRDVMAKFRTLSSEHFTVRMEPHEADVYGADVLSILERAHSTLTKKYGIPLRDKTIVEIFPDQKDFAIRTFGLPGGAGYLGVCFGRVITANSPAARPGSANSWEAVLWHEFTHVVTRTATKNKMPRWLSEGISVHEERQQRAAWGEQMKPLYRRMMLGEDLTPVSKLSGAFLSPKTPAHLGFAYYESSLAVEWLINRWGLEKMRRVLADLAKGAEINTALASHFAPIEKLDTEFAEHARTLASKTGPNLDWTKPPPREIARPEALEKYLADKPNNFDALMAQAQRLIAARDWAGAKAPLEKVIELYPDLRDANGPHSMLARVQHELGEIDAELTTLTRLAELSPDAIDAFERLMTLHAERKQWPKVLDYAERSMAVNPLHPEPHLFAAEAHEATGDRKGAIADYRTLIALVPPNPAETHFRLARLLHAEHDTSAKRHVLLALEEAPRFRAAHELLLEIAETKERNSR
jgi:tetratricopeptide (TPR) repeat protein